MKKNLRTASICVQGGYEPKNGEPIEVPIYQSTTFKYDNSEEMAMLFDLKKEGYFYTRLQNPTNDVVAKKIAELEGGVGAVLTSSGQAANFYAVFNICEAGDHIVTSNEIYGGTFNLFGVTLKKLGIECTFVNPNDSEEEIQKAFRPNTKVVFGETISNPGCAVLDIEKFARIAHKNGVPLIVDNTFATPINCRPFEWAAVDRRSEGVVNDERHPILVSDACKLLDVENSAARVADGFAENNLGVRAESLLDFFFAVVRIHESTLDAKLLQGYAEEIEGATINLIRSNDMVARFADIEYCVEVGSLTAAG